MDCEKNENKKNFHIIMLLDNAFEPDVRVYKEAKYLIEQGYDVEIICMDKKNKYKDIPVDYYDGIKITRFFVRTEKLTKCIEKYKIVNKLKKIIYFYWLMKFMKNVKEYLKCKKFQIIHCHDFIMAFCATLFFKRKDIVFDMHEYYGNNKNKLLDIIIKRIVKYTQNKSRWIIYVNDFQKRDVSKKNLSKLVELPNYPAKNSFKNIKKKVCNKLRISYIGTVRDYASLSKLIMLDLPKEKYDIKIYGNGSAYDELLKLSRTKNIQKCMMGHFDGTKDSEEIYNNTDILYSVFDEKSFNWQNWKNAMPIKSYEAIISLTPIIATKNTKLGEMVQKYDIGYCVDTNNYNLEELFRNITKEDLDLKIENLKRIKESYVWENVVKNLNKIYN